MQQHKFICLLPVLGTALYIVLYFVATVYYPGGSQANAHSHGFSWMHNYWCNLLSENAVNGQPNTARPIALTAMFVLCTSLIIFWYIAPRYGGFSFFTKRLLQLSGTAAMVVAMFIFTSLHNIVINLASLFGLVAIAGVYITLYKLHFTGLLRIGLFTIVLIAVNNILYYNPGLIYLLPFVQKLSFLYFLLWMCLVCARLYKMERPGGQRALPL